MKRTQQLFLTTCSGLLFTLGYCLITASSSVLVNHAERSYDELLLMFLSFLFTTFYFHSLNISKLKTMYHLVYQHLFLVIMFNITTAIVWLSTFYGLKYLSPAIFVVIYMGSRPLSTYLLTFKDNASAQRLRQLKFALLIAVCFLALLIDELSSIDKWLHSALFMLLALVAGITASLNNLYAYQLGQRKMTTSQVVAVRFTLLLGITMGLLIVQPTHMIGFATDTLTVAILVAIVSVALPVYCLQKGLEKIGPMRVSFLVPFIPLMTYLMQLITHYDFDSLQFALICALTIILLFSQRTPKLKNQVIGSTVKNYAAKILTKTQKIEI